MNKSRFVRQICFAISYGLVLYPTAAQSNTPAKGKKRYFVALLCILTILPIFGTVYAQANNQTEPLNETEKWAVLNGAFQAGAASGATSLAEATALRQEVLLIERHAGAGSQDTGSQDTGSQSTEVSRSGDAYIYDYTTDTLNIVTVDLATGQATNVQSSKGVQIALTQAEAEHAQRIAVGNTEILEQIKTTYREQTGSPFTELEQIEAEAAIFTAVDSPNIVNMQSAECGIHRCAVLTFKSADGTPMGIQPIVDLSIQLVVQNITDPEALVSPPGDLGFSDTGMIVDENSTPVLPGATNNPLAAAESENLGIANTGMIIDESAVPNLTVPSQTGASPTVTQDSLAPSKQTDLGVVDTGTILSESDLSNNASTSPSHQNDLGTVNTGLILDDSPAGPTGPTGQGEDDLVQSDPNNLEFVNTGAIMAESAEDGNQQTVTLGAAKANIFIPFMARRLFKNRAIGLEITFHEELFVNWWCAIVGGSPLAAEVSEICNR